MTPGSPGRLAAPGVSSRSRRNPPFLTASTCRSFTYAIGNVPAARSVHGLLLTRLFLARGAPLDRRPRASRGPQAHLRPLWSYFNTLQRRGLVFRLGRIDLVYPIQDAALQVQNLLEPDRSQEIRGFRAPPARLAVHDDLIVRVELVDALRHVSERDELGPGDAIDLVLVGLPHVDDARQHAEHAAFGAARDESRRRRLGIQAAIARTVLGREYRRLAFETEDAAVGVRLAGQHARVVDQIACRKIVRAVDDHVVRLEQLERVL